MGLIQAAIGAIGGTLGDQWLDFYGVPDGVPSTAALFPAVRKGQNAGRGSNDSASNGVITNGSKIIVPEGYGVVLFEDGGFTGFAAEPARLAAMAAAAKRAGRLDAAERLADLVMKVAGV